MATAAVGPEGNTIFLNPPERLGDGYKEFRSTEALKPGHLLQKDGIVTAGTTFPPDMRKCKKHATRGGKSDRTVAIEDGMVGGTCDTEYASGGLVRALQLLPGDLCNFRLKLGENVVHDDYLISYGDGTLCKAASSFLANNVADSDATAAGTSEAAFSTGSVTIPANTLKVGDAVRVQATVFVADNNSTDTLTLRLKIGSTVIIATAAVDVADNDVGRIDATLIIRTIGASGTFVASGTQALGVPGTVTAKPFQLGSTAIDTTVANTLTVTAQWSASHADNDAILRTLVVEKISAGSSSPSAAGGVDLVCQSEETTDLSAEVVDGWVKARVLA